MKIEIVPLSEITPYDNNPRDNDAAVEAVASSIKEFGFRQPIVVDSDYVIVVGHTRYNAAQKLNLDTVPVHVAKLSAVQVRAYRLEDNKSGELADWDFSKLKIELDSLKADEFDFGSLSFSTEELAEAGHGPDEPPDEPPVEPPDDYEPVTVAGELIELGRHRVLCGDSTKGEDVERLMGGEVVEVCLTDPPYSVNYDRSQEQRGGNAAVHQGYEEAAAIDPSQLLSFMALVPSDVMVWSYPIDRHFHALADAYASQDWDLKKELVWIKDSFSFWMGAKYQQKHEPIMLAVRKGNPIGGNVPSNATTVFEYDRPKSHDIHPTAKPIGLWGDLMNNHTTNNGSVYDPFLGGGTTLIAAENLNRTCYGIEISPKYCDVIVCRYLKHVGPDKHPELAEKYERLLQL